MNEQPHILKIKIKKLENKVGNLDSEIIKLKRMLAIKHRKERGLSKNVRRDIHI